VYLEIHLFVIVGGSDDAAVPVTTLLSVGVLVVLAVGVGVGVVVVIVCRHCCVTRSSNAVDDVTTTCDIAAACRECSPVYTAARRPVA